VSTNACACPTFVGCLPDPPLSSLPCCALSCVFGVRPTPIVKIKSEPPTLPKPILSACQDQVLASILFLLKTVPLQCQDQVRTFLLHPTYSLCLSRSSLNLYPISPRFGLYRSLKTSSSIVFSVLFLFSFVAVACALARACV